MGLEDRSRVDDEDAVAALMAGAASPAFAHEDVAAWWPTVQRSLFRFFARQGVSGAVIPVFVEVVRLNLLSIPAQSATQVKSWALGQARAVLRDPVAMAREAASRSQDAGPVDLTELLAAMRSGELREAINAVVGDPEFLVD